MGVCKFREGFLAYLEEFCAVGMSLPVSGKSLKKLVITN